ncbi:MAG TPA: tryptophanase [Candidatus Binatia bacterium]|nr:tryptophanase [Candidatus Binatia bacterium]
MDAWRDVVFSVPYEIAAVRPLRQTTPGERLETLRAAHFNTELIPQDMIYVDLSTDSGVSSISTNQLLALNGGSSADPGMGLAAEGSRAFARLAREVEHVFGFPFMVPTTQGRSAERIWSKISIRPGSFVCGNMLFPSTRTHIEMNGAKLIDVVCNGAHELMSDAPFKGNVDVDKLTAAIAEYGAEKMSCVYVEVALNACGGHPVSLGNLAEVRAIATAHKIPLFLDASRILENSFLVKQREAAHHRRTVLDIVRETCALADAVTMSALKDFLVPGGGLILTRDESAYRKASMQSFLDGVQLTAQGMDLVAAALEDIFAAEAYLAERVEQVHYLWRRFKNSVPVVQPACGHAVFIDLNAFLADVPAQQFPAEALAAFIYQTSGVRITKGPPAAPSQAARGAQLLRLAVPARKYRRGHLDDVAESILYAHAHRGEIRGLKKLEDPGRSKYDPVHFIEL